jgi:transcriptional regulator of acetoin/glycerol metabolism
VSTVREFIRISWERSLASLVDADHAQPAFFEHADESVLLRAARPVLASLSAELANEPACLILTDANGVVLQRGGGDHALLRALDSVHLAPGFRYGEGDVGTNGIGTALEMGAPILVNGNEHYTGPLRKFSCGGALITHPVSGSLLGVIDITTKAENTNSLLLSFAKLAARRIQERILEEANERDSVLLGGYYAACRHSGGPVIAVGDKVFMINEVAQQHFDATDQAALLDHTREAIGRVDSCTFIADLPSGITARLAYQPAFAGEALAGGIIQIKEHRPPRASSPSKQLPLVGIAGTSAVWRRVAREAVDAIARAEWVVVEGEAGVGKLALITAAHRYCSPPRRLVVLDAATADESLVDQARTELAAGSDLVLQHADLLPAERLDELSELFQEIQGSSIPGTSWVALTTGAEEIGDPAARNLLHFFPRTIVVPPLRHHLEDLSVLVRTLLDRAGAPELTLTKPALNQLMRYPWPGNIAHLKATLGAIVRIRRAGEVGVLDLPAECRATSRRSLTRLEALERDAVIDALARHDGDKVAASESLGMSRATIYRKIRDYGIVT